MKPHYTDIEAFLRANFDCTIFKGDWGDPFPNIFWKEISENNRTFHMTKSIKEMKCDWIFSWLCPWKFPKEILSLAKKGAINFHPGPPKYPGIGCYNYAIWHEDKTYGVTAHLMDEQLDHGKIIDCYRFQLIGNETINTLKNRAIVALKNLFYDTMELILDEEEVIIVDSHLEWGVYKSKKDFEKFCKIEIPKDYLADWYANLDIEILERKLRATYYPGASEGPHIMVNGKKWRLTPV